MNPLEQRQRHTDTQQRLAEISLVVDQLAQNADALYLQLKAYGEVTAKALADLEARLKAVEAHTHEPQSAAVAG